MSKLDDNDWDGIIHGDNHQSVFGEGTLSKEEITQKAKDDIDYVEKDRTFKRIKFIGGIVIGAIIVTALAFVFFKFSLPDESTPTPTEPESNTTQSGEQQSGTAQTEKPLLETVQNPPEIGASSSKVSSTVIDNGFETNEKQGFTVTDAKTTAAQETCEVQGSTDFCYAGEMALKDNTYNVYLLRDALHSRFFENPENFKAYTDKGTSLTVATMKINLDGSTPTDILVIVNKDGSGFMITSTNDSIQTLLQTIKTH